MSREIRLVRHGDYDPKNGNLTVEGIKQAVAAGENLAKHFRKRKNGDFPIVLAANLQRAFQTAQVIAEILDTVLIPSPSLTNLAEQGYSNLRKRIEEEGDFSTTFEDYLRHYSPGGFSLLRPLVVVTQAPCIRPALGMEEKAKVGFCEIHEYLPGVRA